MDDFAFCSCDHVWLKQLIEDGGTVNVDDDVMCGGVAWNELNVTQMLEKCERIQDKGEKYQNDC